jgi:ketosteroid isomerase-like protein
LPTKQEDRVSDESAQLVDLEREWMECVQQKDLARLETILADDYTYCASGHGRLARQDWLDTVPVYDLHSFSLVDPRVRVYGDVAVVVVQMPMTATVRGAARNGEALITDTWVRRGGRWQVVARSSILTPASAN